MPLSGLVEPHYMCLVQLSLDGSSVAGHLLWPFLSTPGLGLAMMVAIRLTSAPSLTTLTIPAGTQMVGEAWSVIAGKGSTFQDMNNPQPVVQVGVPGSSGLVEITDIIFSTIGPAGGTIVVELNVKQTTQGGAGMWDSHIRLGGGRRPKIDEFWNSDSIINCARIILKELAMSQPILSKTEGPTDNSLKNAQNRNFPFVPSVLTLAVIIWGS
ncbi:hypothetical protein C8R44DRAFT_731276 [Mycena epipterygia]|nr:hypothetical protein C8R44DRAFT_731276 [Mycena epipterygia]